MRNYIGEEVRVLFLGDKTIFDDDLQKKMNDLEEDTKDYNKMTMLLAINYGGRDEIVHAAKYFQNRLKEVKSNLTKLLKICFRNICILPMFLMWI